MKIVRIWKWKLLLNAKFIGYFTIEQDVLLIFLNKNPALQQPISS